LNDCSRMVWDISALVATITSDITAEGSSTPAILAAHGECLLPEETETATDHDSTPSVVEVPDQLLGFTLEDAVSISDSIPSDSSVIALPSYPGMVPPWRDFRAERSIDLTQDAQKSQTRIRQHFSKISLTMSMYSFIVKSSIFDSDHGVTEEVLDIMKWKQEPPFLVLPFSSFQSSFYHPSLHELSFITFKQGSTSVPQMNIRPRVYACLLCPRTPLPSRINNNDNVTPIEGEEALLINFFKQQVEDMSPEDESSIKKSISRNETFYLIWIGSSNQRKVLAAANYVRTKFGIWFYSLAVLKDPVMHYGDYLNVRRSGVGSYLLQFAQMRSAAVEWNVDLYFNASPNASAKRFFRAEKRYVSCSLKDLNPLPKALMEDIQRYGGLSKGGSSTAANTTATAETLSNIQDMELELHRSQGLQLIKRVGGIQHHLVQNKFLSAANDDKTMICLMARKGKGFAKFPLYSSGRELNKLCHGLLFFNLNLFKYRDKEQAVFPIPRDKFSFKQFANNAEVDSNTFLQLRQDNVDKTFQWWANDSFVQFFQCWLLRDKQSPIQNATTCIPPLVALAISKVYESASEGRYSLEVIHKYMIANPTILHRSLIFLPRFSKEKSHWWGWAAINPYRAIENAVFHPRDEKMELREGDGSYVYGLLRSNNKFDEFHDGNQFLWFLNLASVYRDMRLGGTLEQFAPEKISKVDYGLMGYQGPFGNVHHHDVMKKTPEESEVYYEVHLSALFPQLHPHHPYDVPLQDESNDAYNCGILWLLFVTDVMLSFAIMEWRWSPTTEHKPTMEDEPIAVASGIRILPRHIQLGSLFQSNEVRDKTYHGTSFADSETRSYYARTVAVCHIMRMETQIVLERLRHLDLVISSKCKSASFDVDPAGWGRMSTTITSIVSMSGLETTVRRLNKKTPSYKKTRKRSFCKSIQKLESEDMLVKKLNPPCCATGALDHFCFESFLINERKATLEVMERVVGGDPVDAFRIMLKSWDLSCGGKNEREMFVEFARRDGHGDQNSKSTPRETLTAWSQSKDGINIRANFDQFINACIQEGRHKLGTPVNPSCFTSLAGDSFCFESLLKNARKLTLGVTSEVVGAGRDTPLGSFGIILKSWEQSKEGKNEQEMFSQFAHEWCQSSWETKELETNAYPTETFPTETSDKRRDQKTKSISMPTWKEMAHADFTTKSILGSPEDLLDLLKEWRQSKAGSDFRTKFVQSAKDLWKPILESETSAFNCETTRNELNAHPNVAHIFQEEGPRSTLSEDEITDPYFKAPIPRTWPTQPRIGGQRHLEEACEDEWIQEGMDMDKKPAARTYPQEGAESSPTILRGIRTKNEVTDKQFSPNTTVDQVTTPRLDLRMDQKLGAVATQPKNQGTHTQLKTRKLEVEVTQLIKEAKEAKEAEVTQLIKEAEVTQLIKEAYEARDNGTKSEIPESCSFDADDEQSMFEKRDLTLSKFGRPIKKPGHYLPTTNAVVTKIDQASSGKQPDFRIQKRRRKKVDEGSPNNELSWHYLDKKEFHKLSPEDLWPTDAPDLRGNVNVSVSGIPITLSNLNNPETLPVHYKDYPSCMASVSEAKLGIGGTKMMMLSIHDHKNQLQKIENPSLRAAYHVYRKKAEGILNLEADIHQLTSVKAISFEPAKHSRGQKPQHLLGDYMLEVEREDGSLETVKAGSDWVHNNFDERVLSLVQQVAFERKRSVGVRVPSKKRGKTKRGTQSGFVDVPQSENAKIFLDERQVSKLKVVPGRLVYYGQVYEKDEYNVFKRYKIGEDGELVEDRKGKKRKRLSNRSRRRTKDQWWGLFPSTTSMEKLSTQFVYDNFPAQYVEQVKSICSTKRTFVQVPPGDSRHHPGGPIAAADRQGPTIKYKQRPGDKTCLTASMASALDFLGLRQIASELNGQSKKMVNREDTWTAFTDFMLKKSKYLRSMQIPEWDIFQVDEEQLVAVQLEGSDGKCDHAVTVCGKWIFDSNLDKAMELSQEALDLCCSSHETRGTFVKVDFACHFPNYEKHIGKKKST
jgi:hypothetical protein